MGTNRQTLLHQFATLEALLCGVAGVHLDHLMTGSFGLISKDVDELAPTRIQDGLGKMVIVRHPLDVQLFGRNELIALCVRFGCFEMEIAPLAFDLQMGLCGTSGRFASSLALFLASGKHALLASEGGLTFTIEPRIIYAGALTINQEGRESHINADSRVATDGRFVCGALLRFTNNEGIPVMIRTVD